MGLSEFGFVVVLLLSLAALDLIVGVSNDAVNFLNSSIGSRVAKPWIIFTVAGIGIMVGVIFSSGMMEIARKGIFHPQFFTMPDLMMIFLAVMLADVLILDRFNSLGLPTSTTVSIIFELLGAAVAVSALKISASSGNWADLSNYINTAKAMAIIFGILLSVVIAFTCGAIIQFFTRLIFTFNYQQQIERYGGIWCGLAMAAITYFLLLKGIGGSLLVSTSFAKWIQENPCLIISATAIISAVFMQLLLLLLKINILKIVVLIGTFSLAMAFAANDLVNFIGVPLAGLQSYRLAAAAEQPLALKMHDLNLPINTDAWLVLLAGVIMFITLFVSRKARSVTETEVNLARQNEGVEYFGSVAPARVLVRGIAGGIETITSLIPRQAQRFIRRRISASSTVETGEDDDNPSFDLLRASVNLMVASSLISFATSYKLPLSTTYVTFMVAMGTSFADGAWGRDSAVYRVTGVLTVITGWFITAAVAFFTAAAFALVLLHFQVIGIVILLLLSTILIANNLIAHRSRAQNIADDAIFNLKKISDPNEAVKYSFQHASIFLNEVSAGIEQTLEGLFVEDLNALRAEKKRVARTERWAGIITANIFKALRLINKQEHHLSAKYADVVRCLQAITEIHRDIVNRSYYHLRDAHKGLLRLQIQELRQIKEQIVAILQEVQLSLSAVREPDIEKVLKQERELSATIDLVSARQVERVQGRISKTRLSILYFAITKDAIRLCRQNARLLDIFHQLLTSQSSPPSPNTYSNRA